jgi:DHA2 family multidrug resistance protein
MHGAAMLDHEITRQAQIIGYVDDFKPMLVLAIVVLPLLLLTRRSPSDARSSAARSAARR